MSLEPTKVRCCCSSSQSLFVSIQQTPANRLLPHRLLRSSRIAPLGIVTVGVWMCSRLSLRVMVELLSLSTCRYCILLQVIVDLGSLVWVYLDMVFCVDCNILFSQLCRLMHRQLWRHRVTFGFSATLAVLKMAVLWYV